MDENPATQLSHPVYPPTVQRVVVSGIRDWGRAKTFTLVPDREMGENQLLPFRAGQYISVNLEISGCTLTRAYSLCSTPLAAKQGRYAITVERCENGYGSDHILNTWQVGTKVEISEPLGTFFPVAPCKNVVALAGGSGITPFFSMAGAIADGMEDYNLTILYGNRTAGEILFREELETLCTRCGKLRLIHVLSEEQKPWAEHGVITAELVDKYAPKAEWSVFVCGAPSMYAFLRQDLKKLRLPGERLRFEMPGELRNAELLPDYPEYARGKTFTLTVERAGVSREILVRSGESLLMAMERAGIRSNSRCRCGECGFCRSELVSGRVFMPREEEKRPMAELENGYIHPCRSYPVGDCHIRLAY